eukprot:1649170-Rhodomonas_salina.1
MEAVLTCMRGAATVCTTSCSTSKWAGPDRCDSHSIDLHALSNGHYPFTNIIRTADLPQCPPRHRPSDPSLSVGHSFLSGRVTLSVCLHTLPHGLSSHSI